MAFEDSSTHSTSFLWVGPAIQGASVFRGAVRRRQGERGIPIGSQAYDWTCGGGSVSIHSSRTFCDMFSLPLYNCRNVHVVDSVRWQNSPNFAADDSRKINWGKWASISGTYCNRAPSNDSSMLLIRTISSAAPKSGRY